jgi:hypothetical protein
MDKKGNPRIDIFFDSGIFVFAASEICRSKKSLRLFEQ